MNDKLDKVKIIKNTTLMQLENDINGFISGVNKNIKKITVNQTTNKNNSISYFAVIEYKVEKF